MAERILSGKIKQLVYTTEELSQSPLSTTVIDNGVLVYEKTSSGQIKCKMGDGNNVWSGLEYIDGNENDSKVKGIIDNSELNINSISMESNVENLTNTYSCNDLPYELYNGSAVVYNNKLRILGSEHKIPYGEKFSNFNNDSNSWNIFDAELAYNFYGCSAVVYNNEIHILCGSSNST